MIHRVGDEVYFSKERLERAIARAKMGDTGKGTTTDEYIIKHHDKPHRIKEVKEYNDSIHYVLEGHHGAYNRESFGGRYDELPEELFTL